jgi:putative DNA primase/helicase
MRGRRKAMKEGIEPQFDIAAFRQSEPKGVVTPSMVRESVQEAASVTSHDQLLEKLLEKVNPVDFEALAFPDLPELKEQLQEAEASYRASPTDKQAKLKMQSLQNKVRKCIIAQKHLFVMSIEQILDLARKNNWGICRNHDFFYLYNGAYWSLLDKDNLQTFLGKAAEKMGVDSYDARFYKFQESLFKQFLCSAHFPQPTRSKDVVLVNLANGTFVIKQESRQLKHFNRDDFLTYQLPFAFQPEAECSLFIKYLDRVLPEKKLQSVLAEYMGYIFTRHLKLEKCLLLQGSGANGKSVFFEVITAMLGSDNTSFYSLADLGEEYNRAHIANKLLNYGSEIKGNIESDTFKKLASGEPVPARLLYCNSFIMTDYARLCFNCNELPRDVEHSEAYFRRFLIIPFEVTIPEEERNPELANQIIRAELPGVFNWVLDGLKRLLHQGKFTDSPAVRNAVDQYRKESDSVYLFLDEENYQKSVHHYKPQKEVYSEYRAFCMNNGHKSLSNINFGRRLKALGHELEKKSIGQVVWIETVETPFTF